MGYLNHFVHLGHPLPMKSPSLNISKIFLPLTPCLASCKKLKTWRQPPNKKVTKMYKFCFNWTIFAQITSVQGLEITWIWCWITPVKINLLVQGFGRKPHWWLLWLFRLAWMEKLGKMVVHQKIAYKQLRLFSPYLHYSRFFLPQIQRSTFGGYAWTLNPTRNKYYYYVYGPDQPDLNLRIAKVQNELKKVVRHWLEFLVSGSCPYLTCMNRRTLQWMSRRMPISRTIFTLRWTLFTRRISTKIITLSARSARFCKNTNTSMETTGIMRF